jgi:hypothetical protein
VSFAPDAQSLASSWRCSKYLRTSPRFSPQISTCPALSVSDTCVQVSKLDGEGLRPKCPNGGDRYLGTSGMSAAHVRKLNERPDTPPPSARGTPPRKRSATPAKRAVARSRFPGLCLSPDCGTSLTPLDFARSRARIRARIRMRIPPSDTSIPESPRLATMRLGSSYEPDGCGLFNFKAAGVIGGSPRSL